MSVIKVDIYGKPTKIDNKQFVFPIKDDDGDEENQKYRYPCGCVIGYELCVEAERLKVETHRARAKDFVAYAKAINAYDQHYEEQEYA